jgi:hypothetical protein
MDPNVGVRIFAFSFVNSNAKPLWLAIVGGVDEYWRSTLTIVSRNFIVDVA